jgi:hypothetical protein
MAEPTAPTTEKFDFWKLIRLKATTYYKILGFMVHLIIPALIILALIVAFNFVRGIFAPKKQTQQNTQNIITRTGGTTEVKNTIIQNPQRSGIRTGVTVGGIRLGDDNGVYAGVEVSKEW